MKLPEVVKIILWELTSAKFVERRLFVKNGGKFNQLDVACHYTEQAIESYALQLELKFANIFRSGHTNYTCQHKFGKHVADSLIKV